MAKRVTPAGSSGARKTYRSDALRSAHSVAEDLYAIGAIDEAAMQRFDETCLVRLETKKAGKTP